MSIPAVGAFIVLGYLAASVVSAIEGAIVVSGLSPLGAALVSIGIPNNSVIKYETAFKADNFLLVARGATDEMARAKSILVSTAPKQVDLRERVPAPITVDYLATLGG